MNDSIQWRLSVSLSCVIVVIATVAGAFSFVSAYQEANEMQDDLLRQMVLLADPDHPPMRRAQPPGAPDEESRVVVQSLRPHSGTETAPGALLFPPGMPDGVQTIRVAGTGWRAYVKSDGQGARVVAAQPTAARDDAALDGALRTVMPCLILFPILLLLVADIVRRAFFPVKALAAGLERRSDTDLRPIDPSGMPSETQPFIEAINQLLERVKRSVESQHRFVADAAHELRTPLTALSLQAESLEAAEMPAQARERLLLLRQSLHRSTGLVSQLLALARAQHTRPKASPMASVLDTLKDVLEDLLPLAHAKKIDVGVLSSTDALIRIDAGELRVLIKNLVENAIRHGHEGGRVDLSLHTRAGWLTLQVEDDGPGIPEAEHGRVLEPFYRLAEGSGEGSGLGLAIVKTITERSGAQIRFKTSEIHPDGGLKVEISFPQ